MEQQQVDQSIQEKNNFIPVCGAVRAVGIIKPKFNPEH